MNSSGLTLEQLPGRYAVCCLAPDCVIPVWAVFALQAATSSTFVSITRTDRELSIVIDERSLPHDSSAMKIERGFVALRIKETLEFSMVGVLAKLTAALASAGAPVLAISTFQTDVLLVREADLAAARRALGAVIALT